MSAAPQGAWALTSGVGNLFAITSRMNCAISLAGRKIDRFYPKIPPLFNYDEEWLFLTYYPVIYISWSFVLTRCCTPTWVKKILLRAISNAHVARISPAGCKFPTPTSHALQQGPATFPKNKLCKVSCDLVQCWRLFALHVFVIECCVRAD